MQLIRLMVSGEDVTPFVVRANPGVTIEAFENLVQGALHDMSELCAAELRQQLYAAHGVGLTFDGYVPPPDDGDHVYRSRNWSMFHWGTPSQPGDVVIRTARKDRFDVTFKSLYEPTIWLETVAKHHPGLLFRMVFCERDRRYLLRYGPDGAHVRRLIRHDSWWV
jgi:hypothetical protein